MICAFLCHIELIKQINAPNHTHGSTNCGTKPFMGFRRAQLIREFKLEIAKLGYFITDTVSREHYDLISTT